MTYNDSGSNASLNKGQRPSELVWQQTFKVDVAIIEGDMECIISHVMLGPHLPEIEAVGIESAGKPSPEMP